MRIANLRRIVNPPSARPEEIPGTVHQTHANRIKLDVFHDLSELGEISDEVVVTFILPERLAGAIQKLVTFPRGESFERVEDFRDVPLGSKQHMNVIRHDNEGMKIVVGAMAATNRIDYQFGELRLAKVNRPRTSVVQDPVHSDKCFARRLGGRIAFARWQTALKPPGYEERLSDGAHVRQMANVEIGHNRAVRYGAGISH